MREFGFLWSFNAEKSARECLALLVSGDNVREENGQVVYNADDDGWELRILTDDAEALAWYRGFACAFVRMTAGERESELGYLPPTLRAGEGAAS